MTDMAAHHVAWFLIPADLSSGISSERQFPPGDFQPFIGWPVEDAKEERHSNKRGGVNNPTHELLVPVRAFGFSIDR